MSEARSLTGVMTSIKNWEDRIISSMEAGTKNSTGTFFDYTADNPIDKLGQNTMRSTGSRSTTCPSRCSRLAKNPV